MVCACNLLSQEEDLKLRVRVGYTANKGVPDCQLRQKEVLIFKERTIVLVWVSTTQPCVPVPRVGALDSGYHSIGL